MRCTDEAAVVRGSSPGPAPRCPTRVRVRAAVRRPGRVAAAAALRARRRERLRRQPRGLRARASTAPACGYLVAATLAFLVAVSNNFLWNRHWTFRAGDGRARRHQAARFLLVSVVAFLVGLVLLTLLVEVAGMPRGPAQAIAIVAVTPLSFLGEQALELLALIRWAVAARRSSSRSPPAARRARRGAAGDHDAAASPAPSAVRAPAPGRSTRRPGAQAAARASRRSPRELRAHPGSTSTALRKDGRWVVQAFTAGPATGDADRRRSTSTRTRGRVTEAWTGFQVAWRMARGYPGAFGRSVNSPWIWITLCVAVRRCRSSTRAGRCAGCTSTCWCSSGFSVSLAFFNDANLGLSVPLSFIPLAYLWSGSL